MRFLNGRRVHWGVPLANVPVADLPIVHSAAQYVGIFRVIVHAAQLARTFQLEVRLVGVVDVPDVRRLAHPLGLLLESEDGVRNGALPVVNIGVPGDVAGAALDLTRVAEYSQRFGEGLLRGVVRHSPLKVLLVDIDGIVLLDKILHLSAQLADGLDVLLVFLNLLPIPDDMVGLRAVDVLRPAALRVREAGGGVRDLLGVCLVLGQLRRNLHGGGHRVAFDVVRL
mmetsp:Transcript_45990/g.73624  ORF Transcript_45990/g.73624 Transcript_45990/m.73624 type:complete len:226 (-) Transcript_45990:271-948(-)